MFTDEFVNWVENTKQPGQPVFYSLDNEPALWGESLPAGWQSGVPPNPCCNPANGTNPSPQGRTHPTIHPYAPTFNELRDKTIAHAARDQGCESERAGVRRRRLRLERVPLAAGCAGSGDHARRIPAAIKRASCTTTSGC